MAERFQLINRDTPGIPREQGIFNINGPSLIKVPDWIPEPMGRYYLYFAHHEGEFIRLAYSDNLQGPWTVYQPGALHLSQTPCTGHIASPDVHIVRDEQKIYLYFHGPIVPEKDTMPELAKQHPIIGHQRTFLASSHDGIHFTMAHDDICGSSYFRVWQWRNQHYALGMPGILYRSDDGGKHFEAGNTLFSEKFRHAAVLIDEDVLNVYYTRVGDCPERILLSKIYLTADWKDWRATESVEILRPVETWEGADEPPVPSVRGLAKHPVNQVRDPAIFQEDGNCYLLYSFAGEQGIALTQIG